MKRLVVFFCLFLVLGSLVWAGPFGLEMGWTYEDLVRNGCYPEFLEKRGSVTSYIIRLPNRRFDFEPHGIVDIDEMYGLYYLGVPSVPIVPSEAFTNVIKKHNQLSYAISATYGDGVYISSLLLLIDKDNADPKKLIKALEEQNGEIMTGWVMDDEKKKSSNLSFIYLRTIPFDSERVQFWLGYQSPKYDEIENKLNRKNVF